MNDRELDALIDEKLFLVKRYIGNNMIDLGQGSSLCPFYNSDTSAAWRLVEKLYDIGYLVNIEQIFHEGFPGNRAYQTTLNAYMLSRITESAGRGLIMGIAPTMPQSITACALKAIEINGAYLESVKTGDPSCTDSSKKS